MSYNQKSFFSSIVYFFLGEYFSDALRNTLAIVLPILLFFFLGKPEMGSGIGVGALLLSLTDFPDNRLNKFKTAIYSLLTFFLITLTISFSLKSFYLMAGVMVVSAFIFSMFAAYGNRMALIGTMAIIVCCFVMGLQPKHPLLFSTYMLVGGIWYYLITLLQIWIFPFRSLHHAVFECLMSSALFLKAKAKNYDPETYFDDSQAEIIKLHHKVNTKHELIRNLLLTDKLAMHPEHRKGQVLLGRALLLIDLYEQLNAVHYDYAAVRKVLEGTGFLPRMKAIVDFLAKELETLAGEMRMGKAGKVKDSSYPYQLLMDNLKNDSEKLNPAQQEIIEAFFTNTKAVSKLLDMLRNNELPQHNSKRLLGNEIEYQDFLSKNSTKIWEHLTFSSPVFRFSLRLAICFLFGFFLILKLDLSRYSYWLFLTIVVVARPKFTITWKRNLERISGSMVGIITGLLLVYLVKSPTVLLSVSVIFLLGFFAFNRLYYGLSVVFITLAVILTLSVYHGHFDMIVHERVLYTIIGCLIAVVASYLFPIWDSYQLNAKMQQALTASEIYLTAVCKPAGFTNENAERLARKNANLTLSDLAEALALAKKEPFSHRMGLDRFYVRQVLLFNINALITSFYLSEEKTSVNQSLINAIVSNFQGNKINPINDLEKDLNAKDMKLKQILVLAEKLHR
ncbi:FUSC family membrane protein [Pedobacter aquatilis]|uniref:FUSC family membrane protein n=1 Tax=Pedobacter aquatilis TaxID=351343 RepID=UPI00292EBAE2|nr:FUSC family membrane protein [Pedobacter aquatilis]